jgi:3-dehydrosphinganine reductase
MPGNMDTPGFTSENLLKPKITAEIEGNSQTVSPENAAKFLLASVISKRYLISNDILGELARVSVNGGGTL